MQWTRRRVVVASLAALVAAAAVAAPLAGALAPPRGAVDERIVFADGRAYVLHTPPQLRSPSAVAARRPALVFLGGLGVDPAQSERSTGFDRLSDRDGNLVAYPEGVGYSFNAGLCCGPPVPGHVDDVTFLAHVIKDLKARGAGRISVVGFSVGGMMAYRLACERPELVDTIGVLASTLEVPGCKGPIKALALHGTMDGSVPYTGAVYSERLRCFLRDVRTISAVAPGSQITIRPMYGFPHRWTEPGDAIDATKEFWSFARMSA